MTTERCMFRSGIERAYAQTLGDRQRAGEVTEWDYENEVIELDAQTHYTPDFEVRLRGGAVEKVECKGGQGEHGESRIKWRWAASLHPEYVWVWATYARGTWHREVYRRKGPHVEVRDKLCIPL